MSEHSTTPRRSRYPSKLKAKIALESLKGQKTLAQLATEHGIDQSTIHAWRNALEKRLPAFFEDHMLKHHKTRRETALERENARLKMHLHFQKRQARLTAGNSKSQITKKTSNH